MAISKDQKEQIIEKATKDLGESKALIFADFTGTNVSDFSKLRAELREAEGKFSVIKKRLLGVLFKDKKIEFDPIQLEGTVGTVFVRGGISEAAGSLYRFGKTHPGFGLLRAYDLETKEEISQEAINAIGSLPPRHELLGQVVGSIAAPIRGFMYVLSEKAKKA
ncbi:MAG: 50S ribosomal protein L10 [bacterium]|nr:50S ribosomal protein L10 [bacterium]MDZ4231481.1 50S ribosomal protein L10 [Patescibacteria group bacterium]